MLSPRFAARWAINHALPRFGLTRLAPEDDLMRRIFTASSGADLHPMFDQARSAGPLTRGRASTAATTHAAIKEVLADSAFKAGFADTITQSPLAPLARWASHGAPIGPLEPPSLLAVEAPDHTRYRRLVTRVFTVRAVERLRDRAVEVADRLLDELEGRQDVDLVEAYCSRLPVTMIGEVLGVPPEEHDRVLAYGEGSAPSLDLGLSWRRYADVERSLHAFETWLTEHLGRVREHPGDDLFSQLVAAQEDGVGLDDEELVATAGLVLAAGFETTVNLLGNGVRLLVQHPDQLASLREADREAWGNAVDEVLRFDPPVLMTGRTATETREVVGHEVRAGARVITVLAAGNRDPEVFEDPHSFDVSRANAGDHLAFSGGRHYCLGAALARMEGEVGLSRLFARFPDVALLPGAERRDTRILRGYRTLPVRLAP
jgi:cytochrome P450